MWMWRLIKFILCAVPAAVLAVAGPWWLHDWMMGQGVPDIAASQLSIVLGATILMIGLRRRGTWLAGRWSASEMKCRGSSANESSLPP